MSEYEDYEQECSVIRDENQKLLVDFESWLRWKQLSDGTVKKHRDNIDLYINEFLVYESPKRPSEGINEVGMFLGHWFIRKAMWASETNIRSYATSFGKFYKFMMERGAVGPEDVEELRECIKDDLPEWIATVRRYDDPSLDPEDVWQW